MDYKIIGRYFTGFFIFCVLFFFTGCAGKEESNMENTYFIELDNFTNDSLKQTVSENIFGKVAYYKKEKLEIISLNFVTDDYPGMHYFKSVEAMEKDIKPGTKKVKITFVGDYSVDSISYSLQKFTYNKNVWNKISDMGLIKEVNSYIKYPHLALKDFGMQIVNTAVEYTYN